MGGNGSRRGGAKWLLTRRGLVVNGIRRVSNEIDEGYFDTILSNRD